MASDKSWVAMEQRRCVVCGKDYETGALLLDRRVREVFDRYVVTGYGLCEDDRKKVEDGDYIVIFCEDRGQSAMVRRPLWDHLFSMPVPDGRLCFGDSELMVKIEEIHSLIGE